MANRLQSIGLGARAGLLAGILMVVLVIVLFVGYVYSQKNAIVEGEVKSARQLVLMAESVREQTADKWELGVYSPEKIRQWVEEADSKREKEERVLDAVPVVNAWEAAQAKAKQGGFQFRPLRRNPRNQDNAPDHPAERKALEYFDDNPNADDYYVVDQESNAVRYFRPIRLTETCLNCHGDPARSEKLWGRTDGKDPLGYEMEGWDEGDLTGAFEVIRPLDEAQAQMRANLWWASGLALLVLAASMGIMGWILTRAITRPVHEAVNHLSHVSDHGDLTGELDENAIGEMGTLSRSFNQFIGSLRNTFKDYRSQTSQIAAASEELTSTADQIKSNAQSTSQRVEQVSGSAQEVNNVVQDVANNITEVSDTASKSTQTTKDGQEAVNQAAQRINNLKESSERVTEIMATIEAIAKKTDLLALNAAIEAANAGEHGKGFAVVADEVRKLAEQTSDATGQVNNIVSELRGHSDESVSAMDQVQSKMDEVLSSIEHTDQAANQIAAAAEELAATMSETTENMGEISSNVDQVAESVGQIDEAANQLSDLASDLQHSLELYRLEESEGGGSGSGDAAMLRKAKSDHLAWRTKLRDLLAGKAALTEEETGNHEKCRLGKWLYSEGMPKYGHMQEMKDLEKVHKQLHEATTKTVRLKNEGKTQEANEEFQRVHDYGEQVIDYLDKLEKKV
jgi:methyl-accepting chemotaxis protein